MFIAKGITKSHGATEIFAETDLHVMVGDRFGIIGGNGSGKTTLLRVIAGETAPDKGSVLVEKGKRVGYLPQELHRSFDGKVLDYVLSRSRGLEGMEERRSGLLAELEELHAAAPEAPEGGAGGGADRAARESQLLMEIAHVDERFRMEGGYDIAHQAHKVLAGLGFGAGDIEKDVAVLSGGWRMRLELARLLLDEPDALLLDEPTNHLDLDSMQWLEDWLDGFKGALLVVSHDRRFLDRTVRGIVAVEDGKARQYRGNYAAYKEVYDRENEEGWKRYLEQQAKIRDTEDFIARNKVRKDRSGVVQARIKMLERMERLVPPRRRRAVSFTLPQPARTGSPAVACEGVGHRFDARPLFEDVRLSILRGEKVALVGPNGSGKTTLLRIMAGTLAPTKGRVALGANVTTAFYAQHQVDALSPGLTVLEEMTSIAPRGERLQAIRDVLGAFLFSSDEEVNRKVKHLSGGEKSRLALARLMFTPAGLTLMDEPTNHLDIESREVLEHALKSYEGTLVFVSHDRAFINALATRTIEIAGGRITDYPGDYDYYVWKKAKERGGEAAAPKEKPRAKGGGEKEREREKEQEKRQRKDREQKRAEAQQRNDLYRSLRPLQERMRSIEKEIEAKEGRMQAIAAELADGETYRDPERVKELNREHGALGREIEGLYRRWEETSREMERLMGGAVKTIEY